MIESPSGVRHGRRSAEGTLTADTDTDDPPLDTDGVRQQRQGCSHRGQQLHEGARGAGPSPSSCRAQALVVHRFELTSRPRFCCQVERIIKSFKLKFVSLRSSRPARLKRAHTSDHRLLYDRQPLRRPGPAVRRFRWRRQEAVSQEESDDPSGQVQARAWR